MSLLGGCAIAGLLGAPALSLTTGLVGATPQGLGSLLAPKAAIVEQDAARDAAVTFVNAMASKDAAKVWMFASEEDQAAFGTEDDLYAAFAETFPVLAEARSISVVRSWQEGDTPFVEARVEGKDGDTYTATLGFWLSDAGDWQVVSGDVAPADAQVAAF